MNSNDYRAQRREQPEPEEGTRPVPGFLVLIVLGLVTWGIGYIVMQTGAPLRGGDHRSAVSRAAATSVNGATVYNGNCAACHQGNGQGLATTFPPLAGSEWVNGNPSVAIAIASHGLQGEIKVNGSTYQGVMPAFGNQLSNEELAAVLTYVRTQWGNNAAPVSVEEVSKYRESEGERGAWSSSELHDRFGE